MQTLVLASQSPRRRDLLEKAGFEFMVSHVKVSEILEENINLDDALMRLALQKAQALVDSDNSLKSKDILVLSADTMVIFNSQALGKPENFEEAKQFLRLLSGQTHQVKTAICLWSLQSGVIDTAVETTQVTFKKFSEKEIENYVHTKKPLDKAGAYGIQELPEGFVVSVVGPLDNVIGLPVETVERILKKHGWNIHRR